MWLNSLIGEIHRRSVWQVMGSYAVVAWIILQLAETLEGLIGLPLWFGPAIVVVVLAGFPILLFTTLTQGGWKGRRGLQAGFVDSAEGGDPSLSSWRPLESNPLKAALQQVFTWRNAIVGGVLMAILLVIGGAGYSGLRSAGIGPLGSLVAKDVFESNENLILAEFEDRTSDGTLGETVTALLRIDLSQSTSVHIMTRGELAPGLQRMQLDPTAPVTHDMAMELAQREGIKAVVSGEVLPLGPGVVVSAHLEASSTGEILVALRETARTIDAVPDAVDRLSAQMRERIGEPLRNIQGDPPLGEVTTGSIEALRKYVQAEWALDMGDVGTAEALTKEAIAMDSTFSMAYRKLGVILSNQGRDEESAREAFTKAYEGRDRLPDRERLLAEAAYHTYVTEDMETAIQAYEGVLAIYPADGIAGNNLGVLYGETDQMEKAANLYLDAIERGHAPAVSYTNAAFTLFGLGQADSASAIISRFRESYPDHPQAAQYDAALAAARFDYDEAEARVQQLLAMEKPNPRMTVWGEAELASYAMIRGRVTAGAQRILDAYGRQEEAGTRLIEFAEPLFEAYGRSMVQLHFLQDPEGAVHILDEALSSPEATGVPPQDPAFLEVAAIYAHAGQPGRARELLGRFQEAVEAEGEMEDYSRAGVLFTEAAIALAEGGAQEAVSLYQEGRAMVPKCYLCGLPELGEAMEAAAMPDSAVASFEEYLDAKALFRSQFDNMKLHRALLGLGRSHEALGQPERAGDYYLWLLDLWSDADPALASRVNELEMKLAALGRAQS
jgi:tetratricopeptide (TPR) repeat protein